MIILDTTVLVYAVGDRHELRRPAQAIVGAVSDGRLEASTTAEVIQEFVHVRARRRSREDAVQLGRAFASLLSPLVELREETLAAGLDLFEQVPQVGCFDAVLAAAALSAGDATLVSADRAFADIPGLRFAQLDDARAIDGLLADTIG